MTTRTRCHYSSTTGESEFDNVEIPSSKCNSTVVAKPMSNLALVVEEEIN